jgi:hypothetical protein
MSALLEYECRVPVDGYEVITLEETSEFRETSRVVRILRPRSKRTRRFDLFESSPSAFLEFAQTLPNEHEIIDLADRYGPLSPEDPPDGLKNGQRIGVMDFYGHRINSWRGDIQRIHEPVELWKMSIRTGDFSKIIRAVQRPRPKDHPHPTRGRPVELLLKEDSLSASARLCIRPATLFDALWAQLLLKIDGNANLSACVQCRKWFTLEAGRGRSDKEYCSNACRMRAYRKRKGNR